MADANAAHRAVPPVAVVGLACKFPDSDDPAALLDVVLTGRRPFRRLPPGRIDLADYYQADLTISDSTYSTRAAVIEGWQFECAAFGIDQAAYAAADPAHWLTLETAARALAAAGLPVGTGLDRDRTGVIIGNTLAGDTSRASALRVRWPYVRRVLTDALGVQEISADQAGAVLQRAESGYLAPFPAMGPGSLAGSRPGTIATTISNYFGFRGGSHAVDSACSSSLQAIASACGALAAGDLDAAIAGGVDLSLDPLELIGLAKAGLLATTDVRVYDENPTGFLPGEGCGIVVLMRTADARAAGLPVYAEILGWGVSAGAVPGEPQSQASSQLLAMQRAYERSGVDPADLHYLEGNGAGTRADDVAELTALGTLRAGAKHQAALGSVKANIGHAKAAAGVAGLIKTVLALGTGVVPPTTGAGRPHELVADGRVTLPQQASEWADGTRLAAVSTMGIGGSNVHVVLRHEPAPKGRQDRWLRSVPLLARAARPGLSSVQPRPAAGPQCTPFLLQAPDRFALAAVLSRLADIGTGMSDAEMSDLACLLGRESARPGRVKVGLVATRQDQLAVLAREAAAMLPQLSDGLLTVRPGVFAADDADGRVTLLLSGAPDSPRREPSGDELTAAVTRCLDTLRWLESVGVLATGAVGHGVGALAGLAWSGVLGESEVVEIAELRAQFLTRGAAKLTASSAPAAAVAGAGGNAGSSGANGGSSGANGRHAAARPVSGRFDAADLRSAIAQRFRFGPPRRRLIATMTGAELASVDDAIDLICSGFAGADRLGEAIAEDAVGATLMLETGPGRSLVSAAASVSRVPAISLQSGPQDPMNRARIAAALFAAGALTEPQALFAGQPSRPVDIWRDQVFIASPCQTVPHPRLAFDDEPAVVPGQPGESPAAALKTTEDDSLASVRDEFERRLPARPLISSTAPAETTPVTGPEPAAEEQALAAQEQALAAEEEVLAAEEEEPGPAAGAGPGQGASPGQDASPGQEAVPASLTAGPVSGIRPWARCFAESLRPAAKPASLPLSLPRRLFAAARSPELTDISGLFTADPEAPRTLAIIEDPADDRSRITAVDAASDAIRTGELVVITSSPHFSGFFATLHAEHPSLGVTVLRMPDRGTSPAAIIELAHTQPGRFRELVVAPDGTVSEPVLAEVAIAGRAPCPLGPDDVVLISRATCGAALALAQVLACTGTGIAVIGRTAGSDDGELVAGLEQLRAAGARVGYEVIDLADQASLTSAVRRIEDRLGPVTAIAHASATDGHVPCQDLTDPVASRGLGEAAATLDRLAAAVRPGQVKLIITVGSVAGRYGLAGAGQRALADGALASRAAELALAMAGCRALHLDLPAWSADGLGDSPDLAAELNAADCPPIELSAASRMLLKILMTTGLPGRLALHGRTGGLTTGPAASVSQAAMAAAGLPGGGRFLREVMAHYPGIELVAGARLSLAADPYLADYRLDGMPVLPPVLALEALAQAASVLAGRPLRRAVSVALASPVLIPTSGPAGLRVCALRDGDTITAALRCADSSYQVDHAVAEFSCADAGQAQQAAVAAATSALQPLAAGPSGLVDGAELYGPVCFQSGRFRRIALLPEVTARSGRALARGPDEQPWYPAGSELAGTGFLLGSPGLNDAVLQVLQACVPHRRVRPAGCDAAVFSGRAADGPVEIRAVAAPVRAAPAALADDGRQAPVIPGQAGAPEAETASAGRQETGQLATAAREMTAEELADMEIAERRPQSRKSRRATRRIEQTQPRQPAGQPASEGPGADADRRQPAAESAGTAAAGTDPASTPPASTPPASSPPASTPPASTPLVGPSLAGPEAADAKTAAAEPAAAGAALGEQRWDVEAVDSAGHLLAAWRGVRLHDSGPLPRNAAWPPTLLSVFLERSAAELGLGDALRVTVSCGQPDGLPPLLLGAIPAQSAPADSAPPGAPAGRPAAHTASAAGTGLLTGFTLASRAPVPVSCGWSAAEGGHRQQTPAGLASACAQLRTELAEPPAILAARLDAIRSCLAAAEPGASGQLSVTRTAADGWALLTLGEARIACAVVELSGVPVPVAIALMTGPARPGQPGPGAGARAESMAGHGPAATAAAQ